MKKIFLIPAIFFLCTYFNFAQVVVPPENPHKVQVAILFDTSNSMDGLIDQAKSRIWNIVNEVSALKYDNQTPTIEFALYHYGNDGLAADKNYIAQILNLTSDLDLISQKLFGLRTNGGSEFCGAVIGQSLSDLNWSASPTDLKLIYIAGNESFAQGPISYKEECKKATARGIFINTIYCGNYDQGVREFWKDGATCSSGDYFNIDSNKEVVHIDTPYDDDIKSYNDSLNKTYYGYGSLGMEKKAMQVSEDGNASGMGKAVETERAVAKSKKDVYKNSSWDLIDAVEEGHKDITTMSEAELPEEFKGKTTEEKKALLEAKSAEREVYQSKIAELAKEREAFIADEKQKRAESGEVMDDFGTSVNESIMNKAKVVGYEK